MSASSLIKSNPVWFQKTIHLEQHSRGCHLITDHVTKALPELKQFKVGLAHLMIMHTSAALSINEVSDWSHRLSY